MRKLTVKNFSVIKDAELEFGKITVLIGPQASGKSLLCKLAYFFQQVVVELAQESIRTNENFEQFRERTNSHFVRWFGTGPTSSAPAEVHYVDGEYEVWIRHDPISLLTTYLKCDFSAKIQHTYEWLLRKLTLETLRPESLPNPKFFADEIRDKLTELRNSNTPELCSYIPSTRSFFLSIQKAILGTAGRMDDISLRFSQAFDYGFESAIPEEGRKQNLTLWFDSESERILKGKTVSSGTDYHFQTIDGRTLPFSVLSSGTQELLPLITLLREYVARSAALAAMFDLDHAERKRLFFLEEPEANIFPSTQYDLVRLFTRLSNEPLLNTSWVITTHSPYILTSFNNLIEAGQAARNNPAIHDEVAKIVPEKYWIKEGDFKAYAIEDGVLKSIVAEDTGLVSANYLDQVSETIGVEFDELLRLGYVES